MTNDNHTTTADKDVDQSPAEAVADVSVDLSADDSPEKATDDTDTQSVDAQLVNEEVGPERDRAIPDPDAADQEGDDFESEYGVPEDELREQARDEAKRILDSIDSNDPSELIDAASDQFGEKHSSILQQFRQTQSQAEQMREQRQQLLKTVERLREVADDEDRLVIKTMAGGIAESLPTDERRDVASEYEQRCGELEAQADQLEERAEALKRDLKKIEFAYQELQNPQGILSEVIAGSLTDL